MGNEIQSLIRHILTAISSVIIFLGLDKWLPLIEYIQDNLESTSAAVMTLVGVITFIIGFFKNKERWRKKEKEEDPK